MTGWREKLWVLFNDGVGVNYCRWQSVVRVGGRRSGSGTVEGKGKWWCWGHKRVKVGLGLLFLVKIHLIKSIKPFTAI